MKVDTKKPPSKRIEVLDITSRMKHMRIISTQGRLWAALLP